MALRINDVALDFGRFDAWEATNPSYVIPRRTSN
jgi:hypothetical protein